MQLALKVLKKVALEKKAGKKAEAKVKTGDLTDDQKETIELLERDVTFIEHLVGE